MNKLSASEALIGFAGWITTRDKKMCAGANEEGGQWAEAVDLFCKTNGLEEPRDGWDKNLTHPKERLDD